MIRVLVVDDEVPFCRALGRMIEELGESFSVVGEAYDGEEALAMLRLAKPDIVFTDIRMGVMDGLQLLEHIKRIDPDVITVVLSAYPEFHYAQKAMQLQTEDYLVKPVGEEEFAKLLSRLRGKWSQIRQRKESAALQALLSGKSAVEVPSSLVCSRYALYLVCAGSFCRAVPDPLHPGNVFWEAFEWRLLADAALPDGVRIWAADGLYDNERLIIVGSEADGEDGKDGLREAERLLRARLRHDRIPITVVALPKVRDIRMLGAAVPAARIALLRHVVFGQSAWVRSEEEVAIPATVPGLSERDTALAHSIQSRDRPRFAELLRLWLEQGREEGWKQHTVERVLAAAASLLDRGLGEPAQAAEGLAREAVVAHALGYDELFAGASYHFTASYAWDGVQKTPPSYHADLVADIERHLQAGFDRPILLQDLSRQFGLVPNYLSAIFRKGTGLTPGEYLTRLRVDRAKQLMKERPDMLLKQVAEAVGFQDPLYFSKVFKKATGFSPSYFLQQH